MERALLAAARSARGSEWEPLVAARSERFSEKLGTKRPAHGADGTRSSHGIEQAPLAVTRTGLRLGRSVLGATTAGSGHRLRQLGVGNVCSSCGTEQASLRAAMAWSLRQLR